MLSKKLVSNLLLEIEGIFIELLELYYKKFTGTVQAADYVTWANHHLYMDVREIEKLASMSMEESLNFFEIEEMFANSMKAIQREAPSKELCVHFHLRHLHSQLLMRVEKAMSIVKEIYNCAMTHGFSDEQSNWQEISDAIDDYEYGHNHNSYTKDTINEMIITHARRLWHTKVNKFTFKELVGQKITAIDSEVHFIIQLERGAIIIECPWRIRDVDGILLGETDLQSNQKEWKSIEELLTGRTIEEVHLLEQCPLLIVQCGNIFLDVFHASSYFDGWTMTDEEDFYMFSMHGGSIG